MVQYAKYDYSARLGHFILQRDPKDFLNHDENIFNDVIMIMISVSFGDETSLSLSVTIFMSE